MHQRDLLVEFEELLSVITEKLPSQFLIHVGVMGKPSDASSFNADWDAGQ